MEGTSKRRRRSYTASFKREVMRFSDVHGNRKAGTQFGVDESLIRDWKKKRAQIFKCERQRRAFRRRKNKFPNIEEKVAAVVKERRLNGLGVSYDIIRTEALKFAKEENIPRKKFKASIHWVRLFMKRQGFSLRRRTSVCQKLPADFEHQLSSFQRYIIGLRPRENFLLGQIGNADEMPIYLDMPRNYTVEEKGSKQVILKTTGHERQRVTVMLAITIDGRKLPPYMIFKRKNVPKQTPTEHFPPGVVVRAQKDGWMTEELMLDWIKTVWANRPGGSLNLPSILALDACRGHLTPKVKDALRKLRTGLVVIPAGMTSVLQPLDVSVNKPVKEHLRRKYEQWLSTDNLPTTTSGKIRRASPFVVAGWVKSAWDAIPENLVSKSFKKCCISNALDGSEDDILWEDSEEEEPDFEQQSGSERESSGDDSSSGTEEEEIVEEGEEEED